MCVCMYVCVCVYVCVCMCVCVCLYVCMCVYINIETHVVHNEIMYGVHVPGSVYLVSRVPLTG